MSQEFSVVPKYLLPDQTDIELASDADLNKIWENQCDKLPPSEKITIEQVLYVSQKESELNSLINPSSN